MRVDAMTAWSVLVDRSDADSANLTDRPTFVIRESLGYLVNQAARLMAADLAERLRRAQIGIGQWAVLLPLWTRDGMTQAELARVIAIEPATMVRTIDRMARDRLVIRAGDPADGRVSRIWLTDRGKRLRDELIPMAVAVNEAFDGRLTASEARDLRRLLAKLVVDRKRR
jgi:DNA-binding MarR family transcriptional regulator